MNAQGDGGAWPGAFDPMRRSDLIDDGQLAFAQQAGKNLG
jgi:hypothetical protein